MPPTTEDLNIQRGAEKCDHCCASFFVMDEAQGPRLYYRLVVLKLWLAEPYSPRVLARGTPEIIFSSYYVLEGNIVNVSEHRFVANGGRTAVERRL